MAGQEAKRRPNPAAERGVMAMTVWSSMAHGYAIECARHDGLTFQGHVVSCANKHASRRAENDPAGSNLILRFKNGDTVPLEDLKYVKRAAI